MKKNCVKNELEKKKNIDSIITAIANITEIFTKNHCILLFIVFYLIL